MFDVKKIRSDFPLLNRNPDLIYFDSGATSLKPQQVIDAVNAFYCDHTANVHRGDYPNAFTSSEKYDSVRKKAADLINCSEEEVIYTHGDTEGLNLVALSFGAQILKKGDVILTTETEHASNILPWFKVAEKCGASVEYIPLGKEGEVSAEAFEKAMHEKVRIVAVTQVSNVLGHINPIREICRIAHRYSAYVVVDGAQSVPHIKVDVRELDCDFLAFSSHKMLGPSGAGVLYVRKGIMDRMEPLYYGGDSNARFDRACNLVLKKGPMRFESGTPAIEQIIGMGAAIDYLREIGMENIHAYECELKDYLIERLAECDNIVLYNPHADCAIVSFRFRDIFSQDAANYLGSQNIAVRSGNHCAKIVKDIIGVDETLRASLYFYNTREEIDRFVEVIKETTLEKCIDLIL